MRKQTTKTTQVIVPAKSKNGKSRSKGNKKNNKIRSSPHTLLSECAHEYLAALADPFLFRELTSLPCIPDMITVPSRKFAARATGTFSANTSGNGWICFNPFIPANDTANVTSKTDRQIIYTNLTTNSSLMAFGTLSSVIIDTGGVALGNAALNSEFGGASFLDTNSQTTNARYRLVGAGLKVSYIGTLLNTSGQLIAFRHPDSNSIPLVQYAGAPPTGPAFADLVRDPAISPKVVKHGMESLITYRPTDTNYIDYKPYTSYAPSQNGSTSSAYPNAGGWTLGAYASGCQSGASFKWEVIALYEAVGANISSVTKSHNDPIGYAAIQTALPDIQGGQSPESNYQAAYRAIGGAMQSISGLAGTALNMGATFARDFGPSLYLMAKERARRGLPPVPMLTL